VWSDEFDGNALNTAIWTPQIGNGGWGNNELQYYTSNSTNLSVANGALHIAAIEENIGGSNYSSARIITNNTYEFQYGKVEARIKVPVGQGIWPAFWMLGANYETVGWPQCGEVDIMEHVNNEKLNTGTMHWFDGNGHRYEGSSAPMTLNEYHVYGAIWNETSVQFSIDGQVYYEYVYSIYNNATPIFQQPFFFLLNVAVGGNWPGSPDGSTNFPATMDVDWVRVYQDNTISTQEQQMAEVKIFPNPSNDNFQIANMKVGDTYVVHTAAGALVQKGMCTQSSFGIDASAWPAGIYFFEAHSKTEHQHHLLVKE
jgi:beta-glucanase (GH16 family)